MPEKLTVFNPMGYPSKQITQQPMAPRLESLDGKTLYMVDARFDDSDILIQQIQGWFADHMPTVKTVYAPMSSVYTEDDPQTWEKIKERGDAAIIAVGH